MSTGTSVKTVAFSTLDEELGGHTDGVPHLLPQAETSILVEDACDGRARVTLTLPWSSAIEVLDLLQRHGLQQPLHA